MAFLRLQKQTKNLLHSQVQKIVLRILNGGHRRLASVEKSYAAFSSRPSKKSSKRAHLKEESEVRKQCGINDLIEALHPKFLAMVA